MNSSPLKWAGGKRWLVSGDTKLPVPVDYVRYVEPFAGGASVFFYLAPESAILSDLNSELINFYQVLRDDPIGLRDLMRGHHVAHAASYYYSVRADTPPTALARAARFLYLNRTCWNGLYRVNRQGDFNVPIGSKTSVMMTGDDFEYCSKLLLPVTLRCGDFEELIDGCGEGDFIFADPPYTVKHNVNGFLKYNEKMFGWDDQIRLHASLMRAAARGAYICVTNANHHSVRTLYADFDFVELSRKSVLAGVNSGRGGTTEALFRANY